MSKVLKVLSLSFLLCLSLVIAPFHISANSSLSAPFVGYNVYIFDTDSSTYVTSFDVDLDMSGLQFTCSNMQSSGGCMTYRQSGSSYDETGSITVNSSKTNSNTIYKADIILDSDYVGYVNITAFGTTKNWYVNGNMISFTWTDAQSTSQLITINSYELNKILGNHDWVFPIESYSFVKSCFDHNLEQVGLNQYGNYIFPNFKLNQNDVIANLTTYGGNNTFELIFYCNGNINSLSVYNQNFSVTSINVGQTWTVSNFEVYSPGTYTAGQARYLLVHVTYTVSGTDNAELKYIGNRASGFFFMPVYSGSGKYISTDFALNFGLRNELLDNIQIIANGTSSSVSSQSDLNQKSDDLNTSSNQLVTQEDSFNNDMNNALQNIDTDFNVGSNFGSKFIASADWVKTQYDRLTGNTPFGSVISFSLLIGLALLLVGKVFK